MDMLRQSSMRQCPVPVNEALTSKRVYTVTSSFPPSRTRPRSLHPHSWDKKDVTDGMQHATLINIVAAVNSSHKKEERVKLDTLAKTLATISRWRSLPINNVVSIPQPKQRIFHMPEATVQRKPVYYKHSASDQEVKRRHATRQGQNQTMKPTFKLKQIKIVENSPKDTQCKEFTIVDASVPCTSRASQCQSRDTSSEDTRHTGIRHGSYGKGLRDSRRVCELAKCDAIDLLAANRLTCHVTKPSGQRLPVHLPISHIRTKSLPSINLLPNKPATWRSETTSNSVHPKAVSGSRPVTRDMGPHHPSSQSRRSAPAGFHGCVLPINGSRAVLSRSSAVSESMCLDTGMTDNGVSDIDTRPMANTSKIVLSRNNNRVNLINMSKVPLCRCKLKHELETDIASLKVHVCEEQCTGEETGSGVVDRADTWHADTSYLPDSRSNRTSISAFGRSLCPTSTPGCSDISYGGRTTKKVKFAGSSSVVSVKNNTCTDVPEISSDSAQILKSSKLTQGAEILSSRDLFRFQQKILPNEISTEETIQRFYPRNSGFTITGLHRPQVSSETVSQVALEKNTGDDSGECGERQNIEAASNMSVLHVNNHDVEQNKVDGYAKRENEDVHLGVDAFLEGRNMHLETDCAPGSTDAELHDYSSSGDSCCGTDTDDDDTPDYYKLVKAVDLKTYKGFEHNKMRHSASSARGLEAEMPKSHYVKIKLN